MPIPQRSIFLQALLLLPLAAAPTDEELLGYIRARATVLERVTPQRVKMAAAVVSRCSIDAMSQVNPHAQADFHVFANEPAALPLFDSWAGFPAGSLLVKEKFGADGGRTQLFTGMWKREKGYFPTCGDWEFFTVDATAGKVLERGKLARCAACHEDFGDRDHVSKSYLRAAQLTGGRIVLHASTAEVHGERLRYEPGREKNTLGYWTAASDHASWTFDVSRPGRYTVRVWQGCGKGSGGSEVEIACGEAKVKFTVEETGGFQYFKQRDIGTLRIGSPGRRTLTVRPLSKPGLAVMDLRQVVLVPAP